MKFNFGQNLIPFILAQHQIIDVVNQPSLSDEELFHSFLESKDREVLAALFKKHMALVFGVCLKYLGEKTTAQDATMDLFEQLIQMNPETKVKNFRGYLYVMTKNLCLMKKRGEKVHFKEISDQDVESAIELHPIDEHENHREELLEKCLKELKDLQHDCVELFYLKKKSYLEISDALKMTLSAVKSHIQNGKRNLKICIEARL